MIVPADLHVHSVSEDGNHALGDGDLSLKRVIDYYGRRGMKLVAITDHAHDRHGGIITEANFNQYLARINRFRDYASTRYGMLLVPGLEISSDLQGFHVISLPAREFISPRLSYRAVLQKIKDLGCFSIACHPDRSGGEYTYQTLWRNREEIKELVDAWEAYSGSEVYHAEEIINRGWPFVASSDFHKPGEHDFRFRMYIDIVDLSLTRLFESVSQKKVTPFRGFPISKA